MRGRGEERRTQPGRLLITGGTGYLGRALAAWAGQDWDIMATRHTQPGPGPALDVRDDAAVGRLVEHLRPEVVIHTAYLQSGEQMVDVNVTGAANVAQAAASVGARLIHISTDFVFDGRRERGGYSEDDAAVPITDYGRAKLAGERAVAGAAPDALIVRTSLIYGGDGPGPHELMVLDALDGRRDVAFFSDELRCPILAAELAAALLELARRPLSGTLHVAGADTVSRLEFARLVALRHGRDPALLRSALSAAARPRRPLNCALDCSRAAGLLTAPPRGVRAVLGAGMPSAGQSLH
ncbi:MAG: dTDP-4-dehydrorhamnose reductase [Gaiellales bacterium]|jgi:dTDP-4-dehydrorhamnose reductase|nr:dTDP-4-dehydrorhamnose reductase [Gaiellales bacterium]